MPRLWSDTIEEHRRAVREATLDTTAALVAERGLRAVTMSRIAAETGIGRATLYKYFSDVEEILRAWHERQVRSHIAELTGAGDRAGSPVQRLEGVLETYASMQHEHQGSELAVLLHRGEHMAQARRHLRDFVRDLIEEGAASGELRDDVAAEELANYCLNALAGAADVPTKAAVKRLVAVTITGLRSL